MFIRKLRPSERAPAAADCICINRRADGQMSWSGSLSVGDRVVRGVSRAIFATIGQAETDAIEWARGHGTSQLFIDVSRA